MPRFRRYMHACSETEAAFTLINGILGAGILVSPSCSWWRCHAYMTKSGTGQSHKGLLMTQCASPGLPVRLQAMRVGADEPATAALLCRLPVVHAAAAGIQPIVW
jgi:hypothetical protein